MYNRNFLSKIEILCGTLRFIKNFDFRQNYRFETIISILDKNSDINHKLRLWLKISILAKDYDFEQNFRFDRKMSI